jgi:predicted RNA-binding protein YlxR (DUF448 family)
MATLDLADEPEAGPLRRCAVTRERLPKERMIRFVVAPDRCVVPDLAARLPGRGIWLSARGDVLETARIRDVFARAARGPVTVPSDFASGLQAALARRIVEHLGLARRAGQAVVGFTRAREWLVAGRASLVMQACDGSEEERSRFLSGWTGRVTVVTPLDGAAMGTVFGHDHVVHVAVAPGRLAERLRIEAGRLVGLRTPGVPHGSGAGARANRNASAGDAGRNINSTTGE